MAYRRGKFGIEYNPPRQEPETPWVFFVVALAAAVALVVAGVRLVAHWARGGEVIEPPAAVTEAVEPAATEADASAVSLAAPPAAEPTLKPSGVEDRPVAVRNLLLRLEEAERKRDAEMAIATIERLRSLPGAPAADLDDSLARRLGALNFRRLFVKRSAQWVAEVTVRPGDAASRIASAHGSTLASLAKLNPALDLDRIRAGQRLWVLDHPRFILVVHRMNKTADLSLKGKFFKRYYLREAVKGTSGNFVLPERPRPFWAEHGIGLRAEDRAELEMLLPAGTSIVIADL